MQRRGGARLVLALLALAPGAAAAQDSTASADTGATDSTAAAASRPAFTTPDSIPAPARETAAAQVSDTTFLVDRVVAVVGNRPVLASQVEEEIFSRESQGAKLPTDPEGSKAVREQIVSSIIDEELLVQQAQRDTSITVTDEEIASGVEEQVR